MRGFGGRAIVAVLVLVGSAAFPSGQVSARTAVLTASAAVESAPGLLPLSSEQIMAAGAAGTGCSWSTRRGGSIRFAAADNRAVMRLASGLVTLAPDRGAHDLFPFTYDRWAGGGLSVRILKSSRARRQASESMESRALLELRSIGSTRRLTGVLTCGS